MGKRRDGEGGKRDGWKRIRELELSNFTTNANYAFSIEGQGGRGRDGEKKKPGNGHQDHNPN